MSAALLVGAAFERVEQLLHRVDRYGEADAHIARNGEGRAGVYRGGRWLRIPTKIITATKKMSKPPQGLANLKSAAT